MRARDYLGQVMEELWHTFWRQIAERPSGPLAFRFYLQPIIAGLIAIHDGLKDARAGRQPYLVNLAVDPEHRHENMREGWQAVSRVFILAFAMDVIYQLLVLHRLAPVEGLVIAVLLAIIPYWLIRGPACRIAAWIMHRRRPHHAK